MSEHCFDCAALRREVDRLRNWQREAATLFDGLQDLGRALDLPLGVLVTGSIALEAAEALRAKLLATHARLVAVEGVCAAWDAEPDLPPAAYNLVDDVRSALGERP